MFFRKKSEISGIDWIIVGLGNPGSEYEKTRHNVGFMVCDLLSKEYKEKINKLKFKSLCGKMEIEGKNCFVIKPTTFMNKSGEAVREAMTFYKLPPEKVLIIMDDISLPIGKIRIRKQGSNGGHNGLKSIINLSNSDSFPRIKIGIGNKPTPEYDLANWVLSKFSKEESAALQEALKKTVSVIKLVVNEKFAEAMNSFN